MNDFQNEMDALWGGCAESGSSADDQGSTSPSGASPLGKKAKAQATATQVKLEKTAISRQRGGVEKRGSGHPRASDLLQKCEKVNFEGEEVDLEISIEGAEVEEKGLPERLFSGVVREEASEPADVKKPDGSKPLRNLNHERFCTLVVSGKPDSVAYREAFGCSLESAEKNAWTLRANEGVEGRVVYLMEQVALGKVLTRQEAEEFLASVVRTPVGSVDKNSPLAQEVVYEENERGSRTKVKMPGKLEALKLAAEMGGYLTPNQGAHPAMRLRLIASTTGDAASIAAELESR